MPFHKINANGFDVNIRDFLRQDGSEFVSIFDGIDWVMIFIRICRDLCRGVCFPNSDQFVRRRGVEAAVPAPKSLAAGWDNGAPCALLLVGASDD